MNNTVYYVYDYDDNIMFDSYFRFMLHLIHVTKICERTLLTYRLIHTSTVAFIIIKRRSRTEYKSINYGLSILIYVSMICSNI